MTPGSTVGVGGPRARRDEGSALVLTMMVMALLTVLATTVLTTTVGNLTSATRTRDAASALNAADTGAAQAIAYLRRSGTHGLSCSPACATNPWGNRTSPAGYSLPGSAHQSFRTWIEPIAPFPQNDPATYRIHSTGRAGQGLRSIEVDVAVGSRNSVPLGMFGRTVGGGGDYTVSRASIFSTGCVYKRDRIGFEGTVDAAYGIPPAVHSSQIITRSQGSGQFCAGTSQPIHGTDDCPTAFRYDQDALGGPLGSHGDPTCRGLPTTYPDTYGEIDLVGGAEPDVRGSYIRDDATLRALFDFETEPFTAAELVEMRARAQRAGTLRTTAGSGYAVPPAVSGAHVVLFFDLRGTAAQGGTVDLGPLADAWQRAPAADPDDPSACPNRSMLVIIAGGNVKLVRGPNPLAASVVLTSPAPYGKVNNAGGGSNLIGTLYADEVDLSGTSDLSLDDCFMSTLSPHLLSLDTERYVEVDR